MTVKCQIKNIEFNNLKNAIFGKIVQKKEQDHMFDLN